MPKERLLFKFISNMLCPQDTSDVSLLSLSRHSLVCITPYVTNTST